MDSFLKGHGQGRNDHITLAYNTVMYYGKVRLLGMCCSTNMPNTVMYYGKVPLLGMCCSTNMPNTVIEKKKTYIEVNSPVLNSILLIRNVVECLRSSTQAEEIHAGGESGSKG